MTSLSPEILGLFAVSALFSALFVWRLLTAPEPLIPVSILRDSVARCAVATNSFGWGAVVALNIYLPVYLQDVQHMSATTAGLLLMILMVVLNISSGTTAHMIASHRRYKILPLIGIFCAVLSVSALAWRAPQINTWSFEIILSVLGLGFGPLAALTGVALQNTVQPWQFGTAVGGMNFMRSLASTILVAVFGAITLKGTVVASGELAWRFQIAFGVAAASLTLALIAMWLMEEKPLSTTHDR